MNRRVQILSDNFQRAQRVLELDKSEDNYRKMLESCYWISENWEFVRELKEFEGFMQKYEKIVLEFFEKYPTTKNLYSVICFYSDRHMVQCMSDIVEKKEHLKKGISYAKLYHKIVNKDYSACIYIDVCLELCKIYQSKDAIDKLSYSEEIFKLAWEYANKYHTLQMLDEYHLVVKVYVADHRQYGKEKEAREKELQYREFSAVMEKILQSKAEKYQEEMFYHRNGIYKSMEKLRCQALSHSWEIVSEYQKDIFYCIKVCLKLERIARIQGLKPLQHEGNNLAEGNAKFQKMLSYGIRLICDTQYEPVQVVKKMLDYFHSEQENYESFMLYLCISFLYMVQNGYATCIVKQFLLTLLPLKERREMFKYLRDKYL